MVEDVRSATSDSDRWHVAVHEAGHPVVGRVLGIPCGQASIIADDDSAGHSIQADPYAVLYRWEQAGRYRSERVALKGRALTLIAGAEAEIEIIGRCRGGDGDDRIEASRAIAAAVEDHQNESAERRLRRFARVLVRRHRPIIESVARELIRDDTLSKVALDKRCRVVVVADDTMPK